MAFRIKDRSMIGFVTYSVKADDVQPPTLFDTSFRVQVSPGTSTNLVVRTVLKALNKRKVKYSFDFDGRVIRARLLSEPGWLTIERLKSDDNRNATSVAAQG